MRAVCVQWPKFGPYHIARLRAANALFGPRGIEIIGLEPADADETYGWQRQTGDESFRWLRVFPGRGHKMVAPRAMEAGVMATLDQVEPAAVAITSYNLPDARACLAWCRRRRRAALLMTDSKADDAPRKAWRESFKRVIVSQYDAAIVAGTPHRSYLAALGFPVASIFQPVDVVDNARFSTAATQARADPRRFTTLPGLAQGSPFFLSVNRFIPRKNVDVLIRAYGRYRLGTDAPWRLVLVGDGPEAPALHNLVRAEGIEGVTFAGSLQIDQLGAYYGLAAAYVHPAALDQWGLVVNEAMAAQLSVLVSRGAGCAQDLVTTGVNGYTFEPYDVDALAGLLTKLATAPGRVLTAMGASGERTISRYRPEDFAQALWQAVEAGISRSNRPLAPAAAITLGALRTFTRDARAFNDIRD